MGLDLKSRRAHQAERAPRIRNRMPPAVEREDPVVEALQADLDLGHPEPAHPAQLRGSDRIRAGFDHQADAAPLGALVLRLRFSKRRQFFPVQRIQKAQDEFLAVLRGVRAPRPAQDQQFHLAGRMPDRFQRPQPAGRLRGTDRIRFARRAARPVRRRCSSWACARRRGRTGTRPGRGTGRVRTLTVATPESVRTGFIRRRSHSAGSAASSPAAVMARYSAIRKSLLR